MNRFELTASMMTANRMILLTMEKTLLVFVVLAINIISRIGMIMIPRPISRSFTG